MKVRENYMSDVLTQPSPAAGAEATDLGAIEAEASAAFSEPEVDDDLSDLGEEGSEDLSSEAGIEAAQKAGEISKKEAANLKKKLKIKVDGEESEVELDLADEEALKREIQKARAFDKRTKEWSGYRSQVEQAFELAKNDPEKFLELMGHDVDGLSEKRLSRKIEEMQKSPEQIEQEKMRQELEELRKAKKEAEEKAQQAALEKAKNEQAAQIESEISSAMDDAKSFLPKGDPEVYALVAQYMLMAINKGYHNVSAKDVIPLVEKRYRDQVSKLLGSSTDDLLESLVSKERLNSYRKAKVQQKKSVPAAAKPKIQDTGVRKPKEEKQEEKFFARNFLSLNPKK